MKYILILIFLIPVTLFAGTRIIGYEYYARNIETEVISDMQIMAGTIETKERWTKISRPSVSSTMDNYVTDGKAKKVVVKEITDIRPNGIMATFEQHEGNIPADYNYSTEIENNKLIEAEYIRRKVLEEEADKEQIRKDLGL